MKNKMFLFGASGHAKVIVENLKSNHIAIDAIIDDNPKSEFILNIPVVNSKDFSFSDEMSFIIAIGDNAIRKRIVSQNQFKYLKSFHSSSTISNTALIGEGTVIMPQVVINAEAKVGKHCILNSRSVIEHDCVLEDYVHISPNASLAGNVTVGEGSHIGIGSCVIQGIKIGKWTTIGAGAVIIKDVPDHAVVVGNPGKIIKITL